MLKLKNLRPKDFADYTCQVSVRNVCNIQDKWVTFRLTNATSKLFDCCSHTARRQTHFTRLCARPLSISPFDFFSFFNAPTSSYLPHLLAAPDCLSLSLSLSIKILPLCTRVRNGIPLPASFSLLRLSLSPPLSVIIFHPCLFFPPPFDIPLGFSLHLSPPFLSSPTSQCCYIVSQSCYSVAESSSRGRQL